LEKREEKERKCSDGSTERMKTGGTKVVGSGICLSTQVGWGRSGNMEATLWSWKNRRRIYLRRSENSYWGAREKKIRTDVSGKPIGLSQKKKKKKKKKNRTQNNQQQKKGKRQHPFSL